jgi:uncharacterized protein (TIGR00255 family)
MKSMTGFGRVSNRVSRHSSHSSQQKIQSESQSQTESEIDVSVRAVNGRYLEIRFHLPREYAGLESDFKSQLSKIFSRGTIDVYVNRAVNRSSASEHASVEVNTALASEWLAAYKDLGATLKLKGDPTLDWLSRVPDVMTVRESIELSDSEAAEAKALVKNAAEACDQERIREGQALSNELERHCAALEDLAKKIEDLKVEAISELEQRYRDRLATGLQKFGVGAQIDEQRIAQEIVIQLDRADISEEIQRLTEHIKAYRQLLKHSEPQGKKLDFYAQELLREVNTIGSKSHIAKLTSLVVEAKTLVERIREQVQNCE